MSSTVRQPLAASGGSLGIAGFLLLLSFGMAAGPAARPAAAGVHEITAGNGAEPAMESQSRGRGKGYVPGPAKWRRAAVRAIKDPDTWVPAAGALVIAAGGWDEDISEWAVESTPVFGSPDRARRASDDLRTATHLVMIGTVFLPPSGEKPWLNRFERLAWEHVAVYVNNGLTRGLKEATGRERPDGSDDLSFPSGHSSQAFAYAAATRRNVRSAPHLPRAARLGLAVGARALAAGTAWARVEGGVHFPTDVLVGAALGNFVATVFHDVFLERQENLTLTFSAHRHGVAVGVHLRF